MDKVNIFDYYRIFKIFSMNNPVIYGGPHIRGEYMQCDSYEDCDALYKC